MTILRGLLYCLSFILADIMNSKARLAWELHRKMETSGESFSLLQLIANDCYKVGGKKLVFLERHGGLIT